MHIKYENIKFDNQNVLKEAHDSFFNCVYNFYTNAEFRDTVSKIRKIYSPETFQFLIPTADSLIKQVKLEYGVESNSLVRYDKPVDFFEYVYLGDTKFTKSIETAMIAIYKQQMIYCSLYIKSFKTAEDYLAGNKSIKELIVKCMMLQLFCYDCIELDNTYLNYKSDSIIKFLKDYIAELKPKVSIDNSLAHIHFKLSHVYDYTSYKKMFGDSGILNSSVYTLDVIKYVSDKNYNDIAHEFTMSRKKQQELTMLRQDVFKSLYDNSEEVSKLNDMISTLNNNITKLEAEVSNYKQRLKDISNEILKSEIILKIEAQIAQQVNLCDELKENLKKIEP